MKMILRYPSPRMFEMDVRAVGIFRITLGMVLLADQVIRLVEWDAFHGPDSLMAHEARHRWEGVWMWSVYWMTENRGLPYLLEAVRLIATIGLTLGIRSRVMAGIAFIVVSSVMNYNPLLLQGGDRVLVVMLFFAIFLPLGGRYSLEALWHGPEKHEKFRSIGSAAYAIQVILVFFMSGILKTSAAWTSDFTAISMAVHLEDFATELARLWRHWDPVAQTLTFIVIWIEWLAPAIALGPGFWARSIGIGALLMLEVGIWLSLEVGLFPFISIISLLPLVPGTWLDLVLKPHGEQGKGWTLYYDRTCSFCLFACRLLKAGCGWQRAQVMPAQDDTGANSILEEHWSWSLRADGESEYTRGWQAVRRMLDESGRGWITRCLPTGDKGEDCYRWIGERRGALGLTGAVIFGYRRWATSGWIGEGVALAAVASVIAWNIATYPAVRAKVDYRQVVDPFVSVFNLRQYWNMFAPAPYYDDWWLIGIGLDRDGNILNVFNGEPLPEHITPPRDGPRHHGGYRWRKIMKRSNQRNEMDRVFRHWCKTGRWQAMSVWVVWRKNKGDATTAKGQYNEGQHWWWKCEGINEEQYKRYEREVAERRKAGVLVQQAG